MGLCLVGVIIGGPFLNEIWGAYLRGLGRGVDGGGLLSAEFFGIHKRLNCVIDVEKV